MISRSIGIAIDQVSRCPQLASLGEPHAALLELIRLKAHQCFALCTALQAQGVSEIKTPGSTSSWESLSGSSQRVGFIMPLIYQTSYITQHPLIAYGFLPRVSIQIRTLRSKSL